MTAMAVRRLNWGCGTHPEPGWINSDSKEGPGIDLSCNIRGGLPLDDDSIDYVVSIHALPEVSLPEQVPVLEELRRVLVGGGVLRLALPDLDRGIRAYQAGAADYFLVSDEEARSLGAKFVTHMLWHGYTRTLFTADLIEELLGKAGFARVRHCRFRETTSGIPEIVSLDNRERESLFVEAWK
ncbi:MAG: putative methyltransferase [Solirubrobacterales bacterium]|nr:putative methyltransferase [Solirubrobacterales bacterium]